MVGRDRDPFEPRHGSAERGCEGRTIIAYTHDSATVFSAMLPFGAADAHLRPRAAARLLHEDLVEATDLGGRSLDKVRTLLRRREIAERLDVPVRMVDNRLASVCRKLGIQGRAELQTELREQS